MKHTFTLIAGAVLTVILSSHAGEIPIEKNIVIEPQDPWSLVRRPITNPTLFDQVIPRTQIHPLFIHQNMPDTIDTEAGNLPVGGSFQVYALQAEFALTERLSLNATKDGFIVFDPDSTLTDTDGWANIAAGLKYAWLLQPERGLASNVQLLFEIPWGSDESWQGAGDGAFIPSISGLQLNGRLQTAQTLGFKIPVDDEQSTMMYFSAHASWQLTDWLFPLVEINWFHVLDPGDGGSRFNPQAGGGVPSIVRFEGGDLVNFGASNANVNEDFVSLGLGARVKCPRWKNVEFGAAWEIPLTDQDQGIMQNRLTIDCVIRF